MNKSRVIVLALAAIFAVSTVFSVRSTANAYVVDPIFYNICGVLFSNVRAQVVVLPPEDCVTQNMLSLLRGMAFLDTNADGKWQAGEPAFAGASFKVTGGGAWYVCGPVGPEATFGVPVNADTYYVIPAAPPGYHTTTPKVTVTISNSIDNPYTMIGFVADPSAKGDACDQYNPPR